MILLADNGPIVLEVSTRRTSLLTIGFAEAGYVYRSIPLRKENVAHLYCSRNSALWLAPSKLYSILPLVVLSRGWDGRQLGQSNSGPGPGPTCEPWLMSSSSNGIGGGGQCIQSGKSRNWGTSGYPRKSLFVARRCMWPWLSIRASLWGRRDANIPSRAEKRVSGRKIYLFAYDRCA